MKVRKIANILIVDNVNQIRVKPSASCFARRRRGKEAEQSFGRKAKTERSGLCLDNG